MYYIGVDDDECSYSLSNALFALSEKLQRNIMYHLEYPDKFAEVRKDVSKIDCKVSDSQFYQST